MKFGFNVKSITIVILLISLVVGGYISYKLITEPINLRFSSSTVDPWRLAKNRKRCWEINRTGLAEANFSGSGALVLDHFHQLKDRLGENLLVINGLPGDVWHLNGRHLRHLCYSYDGTTVTHHDRKKDRVCDLRRLVAGVPLNAGDVDPALIYTEASKMDELGIKYVTPLQLDWTGNWGYIENLLAIFEKADPKVTHLHFHCEHGKGRTTTMMVLYDIFRNAHQVPLEDIVDRHFCIGGEDLFNTVIWKKGTWTQSGLLNRKNLIISFYDYMNDSQGYGQLKWSEWLTKKEQEGYAYLPVNANEVDPHLKASQGLSLE